MSVILKPIHWLYCIYAFTLFAVIMLLIFPFVIISSLFGRIRGGNMVLALCSLWADIWFPMIGIFHKKIFEVPHDKSKPYVFVINHISWLDAAILVKVFRQPVRPLGQVEMSKVPVFGFIYQKAIVSVDRSSPENRAKSLLVLRSIINKGISVIVFPEGTFNLTHRPLKDFYDGAFRLAIETQTPLKPVLFLDGYSRMNYRSVFSLNPGKSRVLFMDEIPVESLTLADVSELKQRIFSAMESKLVEYKAAWIES